MKTFPLRTPGMMSSEPLTVISPGGSPQLRTMPSLTLDEMGRYHSMYLSRLTMSAALSRISPSDTHSRSLVRPAMSSSTTSFPFSGMRSTLYPCPFMAIRHLRMLSKVSKPAAPPTWSFVGGYMLSMIATFLSSGGVWRSLAQATACVAILSTRSGTDVATNSPSSVRLVKLRGTDIICPSYSGQMTLAPISRAFMPMTSSSQSEILRLTLWPCITGTSMSRKKFLASLLPETLFRLIWENPTAMTMTSAMVLPSFRRYLPMVPSIPRLPEMSSGEDMQNSGIALAPSSSKRLQRSSTGSWRPFSQYTVGMMTATVGLDGSRESNSSSGDMPSLPGIPTPSVGPCTGSGTSISAMPARFFSIQRMAER